MTLPSPYFQTLVLSHKILNSDMSFIVWEPPCLCALHSIWHVQPHNWRNCHNSLDNTMCVVGQQDIAMKPYRLQPTNQPNNLQPTN